LRSKVIVRKHTHTHATDQLLHLDHYSDRSLPVIGWSVESVTLYVCVCVSETKKRLKLSTPNLVHTYSMAGHRHALTLRFKGQRSRSQGYEMCCWRGCACWDGCL